MATRARTEDEVRRDFIEQLHCLVSYWIMVPDKTPREMCNGLAFSILNIFDGTTPGFPAMDIVLRPHPSDKEYCQENDENWYEDGMVINEYCHLHDMYYKRRDDDG